MRIAFLSKRFYMGKDVVADRYGRLYQIPTCLARQGCSVISVVSDYYSRRSSQTVESVGDVIWHIVSVRSPLAWYRAACAACKEADVIIASSDCVHVVLAFRLARKFRKPVIMDLYDNYESFGLAKLPFMRSLFRHAIAVADGIICVGDQLASVVRKQIKPKGPVVTLNSTISPGDFYPIGRVGARAALGLPSGRALVGVCGGLDEKRGIDNVYRAIEQLWRQGSDVRLVLAGRVDPRSPPPSDSRVYVLGNLHLEDMNYFYNAVDLNILQYLDNEFGRFAYPQKLDEIISTGAPLIASDVGELKERFRKTPRVLYDSSRPDEIANAIKSALVEPVAYEARSQDWNVVGVQLKSLLDTVVS